MKTVDSVLIPTQVIRLHNEYGDGLQRNYYPDKSHTIMMIESFAHDENHNCIGMKTYYKMMAPGLRGSRIRAETSLRGNPC